MLSLPTDKASCRALLREKRKKINEESFGAFSTAICERAFDVISDLGADTVLLFSPIGKEPNILPLAQNLIDRGVTVAFPISFTEDSHLEFFTVSDLSELREGAYGIKEPPALRRAVCTERSVCIVPALSFDMSGVRIGYGKGYYDRFLADFAGVGIGVVFSELLSESIPHDRYDIPVDLIITEGGVIFPNGRDKENQYQAKLCGQKQR